MSISLYNSCINELEIPPDKPRKIEKIAGYLKSLKNFMLLFKCKKESEKEILNKLSSVMKLRKTQKYEIIVNEGEKGKEFFVLLKGKVSVLTPKVNEYYMSEEEYISYLIQLRQYNKIELIKKCISLNQSVYPINEENFDTFLYNLSIKKTINESYSRNNTLWKKAKNIYQIISKEKNELQINNNGIENKKKLIISPEEYIIQNSVPEEVIKNTLLIRNYLKILESKDEEKKKKEKDDDMDEKSEDHYNYEKDKELLNNRNIIFIPTHEIYGDLEIGTYFGEMAMEEKGSGKRHATLIALEECYVGIVEKKEYYILLHFLIEKAQNKYINFISTFYIFKNLSLNVWEKRYMTLFINRVFEKDYLLLKEGEEIDQIYFTYKGEFEFTVNKNLIGVNELIIHYKKIMINLLSKIKNKADNKKMIKQCNYKEEIKENENFILNKKFHGDKFKKMVFEKNIIKLGIFSSKEIIGLLDIYSKIIGKDNSNKEENTFRIKKYKMLSLLNCKCISCNCEVYSFPLNKFKDMCNNEDKVGELTNELEIQKINYMIKRLKHYKEFLYENLYKKENENKKEMKTIKDYNISRGIKNKFEPFKERSNIFCKNGVLNNNIPIQKFIYRNNYRKKLFNSCTHFICLNDSYSKNKRPSKRINLLTQTIKNYNRNKEEVKMKQNCWPLPSIDDTGTIHKIKKNGNGVKRNNTERKDTNDHKSRIIIFPKKEENDTLKYSSKDIGIENNKNHNLTKKDIATNTFTDDNKNNFINVDRVRDILINKQIIKKRNWVSKILVKNLVYNHIFDKYAFTSTFNSRNNINFSHQNSKNNINKPKDLTIYIGTTPSNEKNLIRSSNIKNLSKSKYNNTETNLFLSKGDNYFYNKSKRMIKNIKMVNNNKKMKKENSRNDSIKNNNGVYDALIFDNFNNYFNDNLYCFFDE